MQVTCGHTQVTQVLNRLAPEAITGFFLEFVPSNYYLMCFGNVLGTWSTTVFLIVILYSLDFFFF